MNRYLLLILLSSWSLLVTHSLQCETGVAFVDSVLSVQRSTMANADVAFLLAYNATSLKQCMEECCSGKYGACSVASFKKNTTKDNCLHFNCRPLSKCKFLSSASTDSFSFSANPTSPRPVPSEHASNLTGSSSSTTTTGPRTMQQQQLAKSREQTEQSPAKEADTVIFSEEQFAFKNDNTTVKPRKGVDNLIPDDVLSKSGIKPRKGVSLEDVPHSKFLLKGLNKSNVKARKGVGPYSATDVSPMFSSATEVSDSSSAASSVSTDHSVPPTKHNSTALSEDLIADLAKILEDESLVVSAESSASSSTATPYMPLPIAPTSSQSSDTTSSPMAELTTESQSAAVPLLSSESSPNPGGIPEPSSSRTPPIYKPSWPVFRQTEATATAYSVSIGTGPWTPSLAFSSTRRRRPPTETPNIEYTGEGQEVTLEQLAATEEEMESDRKYKSSIHLVLSLVFGLLVLFAVLGVVAKRIYDGWLRRDYYRMNYLIDGIYNGVQ